MLTPTDPIYAVIAIGFVGGLVLTLLIGFIWEYATEWLMNYFHYSDPLDKYYYKKPVKTDSEQVDRAHRNGGLYSICLLFHGAYFTMRRYFNCMQVCLAYINTVFIHSDAAKQLYPPSDG